MAFSDQLTKLAIRAKEVEDRVAAAENKAQADLEREVNDARAAAQAQADTLRKSAESTKGKVSSWWDGVQQSWDDHLAAVRKDFESRRTTHDLMSANRAAEQADDDAVFAIDFASAALDEAEYAVLDAVLAHKNAVALANQLDQKS
jgi:hypothetical protein